MNASTQSKLEYLNETKTVIKEAITSKGQTILDTDSFRSYADKILAIEGGNNSNILYTTGSFVGSTAQHTIEHGHGKIPDIIFVTRSIGTAITNLPNESFFISSFQCSKAFAEKIGATTNEKDFGISFSIIYNGSTSLLISGRPSYPGGCVEGSDLINNVMATGIGYCNDTTFKVGQTNIPIANGVIYMWGAISGLTGGGGSSVDVRYVTFIGADGSTLIVKPVAVGDDCADVVARGLIDTPTKESTVAEVYIHSGWSLTSGGSASADALKSVTEDRTVYAAFTAKARTYTVRFYDGDTLMKTEQVAYGAKATPPDTTKEGYGFMGWSVNGVQVSDLTITGDTDFYGVWEEQHVDANGQITDSWETIFANIENGTYKTLYSVSNYKPLDVGTEGTVNMQIVAFDADTKTDGSGKAAISWVAKELLVTAKAHRSSTVHPATWENSKIRSYLTETIMSKLPIVVKNAIVAVDKISSYYDKTANNWLNIATSDTLWIPSLYEVNLLRENEGVTYAHSTTGQSGYVYWKNSYSCRVKYISGDTTASQHWWVRTETYDNKGTYIGSDGASADTNYTSNKYICLGFCT